MTGSKIKVFLLKVKARCNINCSYCYEYNSSDQSWREKPGTMSNHTLISTVKRISEYVLEKDLKAINVVFHGGEPLLVPLEFFSIAVDLFRNMISNTCSIKFSLQTNGILITKQILDEFIRLGIKVGISIDGTKESNDKYRVDFKGNSTFDDVMKGIDLLNREKYIKINGGVLTVINPSNPALETYRFLKSLEVPAIDFLMPHHNYIDKPCFPLGESNGSISNWLITVFDEWYENGDAISIRIFEHIIHLLLGGIYAVENLGLAPIELIVIQTDGAYEAVDSLKSTFDGAIYTGKNVFEHSFDEAISHYLIGSRLDRVNNLCVECLKCDVVKICGGGYIPHRYSENGFMNPSVYCEDLYRLIHHIKVKISQIKGVSQQTELVAQPINH
jgi:uncharacterized protein